MFIFKRYVLWVNVHMYVKHICLKQYMEYSKYNINVIYFNYQIVSLNSIRFKIK